MNRVRIGKSTYNYNYDKLGDALWQCERCSDQAPRDDGQRWRLFVRVEPSQIVAFDVVALEGGGYNVHTERVRFWTRDMSAMKPGWHKWYMGHDEAGGQGDFETAIL
jgi:hypothetical protein